MFANLISPRATAFLLLLAPGLVLPLTAAMAAQLTFATADKAAAALVDAVRQGDLKRMSAMLGPGSEALISSGDEHADAVNRQNFVASYEAQHKLTEVTPGKDVLTVGVNEWPLPIPLVEVKARWHFDTRAGAQAIIDRRIGRNEIAAIRVALTYVDAQRAYFEQSKRSDGGAYAQRLVSTPGRRDGLYRPAGVGEPDSPLGPLAAQAIDEGYPGDIAVGKQIPYQGYLFRILKAQGGNAPGGAGNYMQDGKMTGGFALVAWPAIYGSSGIMTFQVNQDGIVFQKNLGPDTAGEVAVTTRFDPDLSWARVDVTTH